ncbi:sigma-70 family RNA polymerase sigma factor [Sphingobacterium sp. HJSM2_6]|uniref:sigma-70 family RNA polymerase sigma factor n=1 Tax=Sphingobacterium sp. HJSM2_6 TaxID=3366264 RepID=UPI003BD01E1E
MASPISIIETDNDLFDRVRLQDDRKAFEVLYHRYWKTLINVAAQRIPAIEIAEEIVQNVFVDLYSKRTQIVIETSLEAYLKTAIKFQVYKTFRHQQVRDQYKTNLQINLSQKSDEPDLLLEFKQLHEELHLLAKKLPEKCGEVFILSRIEQWSNQDISIQLDISLAMVRKHITKSMNFMRANFIKHHIDVLKMILIYCFLT